MGRPPRSPLFPYTTLFRSYRGPRNRLRYAAHPRQGKRDTPDADRKSTRLNSSHLGISYAVFCLKKIHVDYTKVSVGSGQPAFPVIPLFEQAKSLEESPTLVRASLQHLQLRFFFNDTATTEIYTLSLHDALPIWLAAPPPRDFVAIGRGAGSAVEVY